MEGCWEGMVLGASDTMTEHNGPFWPLPRSQSLRFRVVQGAPLGKGQQGARMEEGLAGVMLVPFPGSWCPLAGKGSLRQEQLLGSPQPACVSSSLRVGSSSIHCSGAKRAGAYHRARGRGKRTPGQRLGRLRRFAHSRRGGAPRLQHPSTPSPPAAATPEDQELHATLP